MEWLKTIEVVGGIASIAGVLFGLPALVIAMVQLWRTKKAAEAAASSAADTARRLSGIVAVASIEQICSRSRDLLHLIRAKNLTSSATAAFELREALAKFCKSQGALQLLNEDVWSKFLKTIAQVHEALECAASIRKIDGNNREQLLQEVATLHSEMSMLSTIAIEKVGEPNAYSK